MDKDYKATVAGDKGKERKAITLRAFEGEQTSPGEELGTVTFYLGEKQPEQSREGRYVEALKRREEHLKSNAAHLEKEKEMLEIGRMQLNRDIQRHQMIMKKEIEQMKGKIDSERRAFIDALVREVDLFKLPSASRFLNTRGVDDLISEAKRIGEDCSRFACS